MADWNDSGGGGGGSGDDVTRPLQAVGWTDMTADPAWAHQPYRTPTSDDLQHLALRRIQRALRDAGLWPSGVQIVDAQGRFTLEDAVRLLHAHAITLSLDVDLGPDVRGMLLYPTRTIFMNARLAREPATRLTMSALVGSLCILFSLLLIHPPYSDTLILPMHYERNNKAPAWPMWRTGVWLSIELLLPTPLVAETVRQSRRARGHAPSALEASLERAGLSDLSSALTAPAVGARPGDELRRELGSYRRAITYLAETRQLIPEVVEIKTHAVLRGLMDALDAPHYTPEQRATPDFPYDTFEMARALNAADFLERVLNKAGAAIDAQIAASQPTNRTPLPANYCTPPAPPSWLPRH